MKKLILKSALLATLISSSAFFVSCDRVKDAVDNVAMPVPFAIKPNIPEQTIPFVSIPMDSYFPIPVTLNVDIDAEIKKQNPNLSVNNLKSAKLESMDIALVKNTLTAKLDAVKSARLYIKTPSLQKLLVATADGGQITADKINFTPVDAELIEYFKSKENSIIVEMQGGKVAAGEMTLKLNPSFRIKVGL